jgi:hypothetical protein
MKHHYTEEERSKRDERIAMEIVVDSYDEEEQMLGWQAYLSQKLHFPFTARCIEQRAISPLKIGDEVEVVGMPLDEECLSGMFVLIKWQGIQFGVPLIQLEGVKVDKGTQQAIEDWHYWVDQDDDEMDDDDEEF